MTGGREDPLGALRLTRVVNAAGTMTALGASRLAPAAAAAVDAIRGRFAAIDQLQAQASAAIARATGAEAGCVTGCAAAGVTLGVAAAMTGADLARIERLPDAEGLPNEVVIQAGHRVHYGAPVDQMITLPGGRVVSAGSAARVEAYHLADAMGPRTAALLHVVSHHVVQEGGLQLPDAIAAAQAAGVPVIVDMAAEYDLRGAIALGADLVVHSAHKFMAGPTAGIVAGRRDLVRAVYLQNRGIGRAMKASKEAVAGAVAALQAWMRRDPAAAGMRETEILALWEARLAAQPGLTLTRRADWTGNPVTRLRLTVAPETAGLHAWELADRLAKGDPMVAVRDDLVERQEIYLDPTTLDAGEAETAAEAIVAVLANARAVGDGLALTLGQWRRARMAGALRWPSAETV